MGDRSSRFPLHGRSRYLTDSDRTLRTRHRFIESSARLAMPVSSDPVDLIHRPHQRVETFGTPLDLTRRLATHRRSGTTGDAAVIGFMGAVFVLAFRSGESLVVTPV
jgi:hypothetical protein